MAQDDQTPEDEFQELMRQLLGGGTGGLSAEQLEQLSQLTGQNVDPAMMQNIMGHLKSAFASSGEIDWEQTRRGALHIANQDGRAITGGQRGDLDQAYALANLWLSEATAISQLASPPRAITRGEWVEATLPVWQELAEPMATSIADALTAALSDQAPDDMQNLVQGAGKLMRGVGGALFAGQLGQVVGNLSKEVVSGGDVGIPLMPDGDSAVLPQNFADFGDSLEIPDDQIALYIATRELAHARLFRHARWLRLHVISQVTDYARGVRVDTSALEELASRFDPSEPEELRKALESGALLPPRSEAQSAALTRLENLLATIEGWVDVVTADAASRLPSADRIAEAVRRRRAVGGPAERALSSLVGLELRPRRMREAAAMWRTVTSAVGPAARDSLWDYPDMMPTPQDIDDPTGLVNRLEAAARGDAPATDDIDDAFARLLAGDIPSATPGGEAAPDAPSNTADSSDTPDDDSPTPEDNRPV